MEKRFSLIPFGGPGTGKSNLLNTICGIRGRFKSSKTTEGGETKRISFLDCQTFGRQSPLLRIFDFAGFGDPDLSVLEIIADIKITIKTQSFDTVLLVIKSSDYRASAQEIIAAKAIVKFLENNTPENIFLVFTHCDQSMPDEDLIQGKINSFKKWGNINITREHVILSDNTPESL